MTINSKTTIFSLPQDLEVTIQAKLQLDKMVQDLKVEKETLLQNQENLHQKVTDLSSERDREKERARVLEERLNHASLSKLGAVSLSLSLWQNKGEYLNKMKIDVPVTSPSSTPFTARSHGHKRTESSKAKWSPVPERKPGLTTSTSTEDLHRPDSPVSFDGQHHRFNVSSLAGPTRCDFCSQIAFGLVRQGLVCDRTFFKKIFFLNDLFFFCSLTLQTAAMSSTRTVRTNAGPTVARAQANQRTPSRAF